MEVTCRCGVVFDRSTSAYNRQKKRNPDYQPVCSQGCLIEQIKEKAAERKNRAGPTFCSRGHPRTPDNLTRSGNCKLCKKLNSKPMRDANIERYRANALRSVRKLKDEVIAAYGGSCACCGEDGRPFLTLDHVDGGGNQDRRGGGQMAVFRRVRKEGFPKGYQVLCFNCNCARASNGGVCPHKEISS